MERTDVLCPRVGLEILQDHGFYNQSRFWLFFLPGRFCRRRRGRRKRRIIRRERRWWCHRLFFFFFFKLRHLSLCSLSSTTTINVYLLLFFAYGMNQICERKKQDEKFYFLCLFRVSLFKIFKNSLCLSLRLSPFLNARALKKRY